MQIARGLELARQEELAAGQLKFFIGFTPPLQRNLGEDEFLSEGFAMDASLANALALLESGYDPALIELTEKSVFPYLIPAAPATARS